MHTTKDIADIPYIVVILKQYAACRRRLLCWHCLILAVLLGLGLVYGIVLDFLEDITVQSVEAVVLRN